jgi:hypothetical protein
MGGAGQNGDRMKVTRTVSADAAHVDLAVVVERMLIELGPLHEGELRITLERVPPALEAITRPIVTMDLARPRGFHYRCCCGWETDDVVDLTKHLEKHGARQLTVIPENYKERS